VEKTDLLDNVNFLFIPILSVDAHENASLTDRIKEVLKILDGEQMHKI
jgi:hypothetical protein